MTFARAASILLASLTITACETSGPGADDEGEPNDPCPATGNPLLPELPRVQPVYTDGCEDSTWATDVEAEVAWTIELERGGANNGMTVVPSADGVVAISGRTARWVTSTGEVVSQRDVGTQVAWTTVQGSTNGQLIVAGSTGASSFYRVLDGNGSQVWLRLLDSQFNTPSILLDGSDLLVGTLDFANDTTLRIARWGLTGSKKGELVLDADGNGFVRDGAGRYGVVSNDVVQVFGSDGTPLGEVTLGYGEYPFITQIVGADDGFYAAGAGEDPFVARISVGAEASVAWTFRFGDLSSDWEFARGLAALPDGRGVVVVGGEEKIRVIWPESPLSNHSQPFVLALDSEGEPRWGERIGAVGLANGVAVGAEGEVYVIGGAQGGPVGEFGEASFSTWVRRYDDPG